MAIRVRWGLFLLVVQWATARRPVRIAVCISGLLRTWRYAAPSVLSSVLLADRSDVLETFLHFGTENASLVNAVRAATSADVRVSHYNGREWLRYPAIGRRDDLDMAVGNALAFAQVVSREREVGVPFDWVVRMRTDDLVLHQVVLGLPPSDGAAHAWSNRLGGCYDTNEPYLCVKDTYAILTRRAADVYYTHFLESYSQPAFMRDARRLWRGYPMCPECRLGIALRRANVSIHLIPRNVLLMRQRAINIRLGSVNGSEAEREAAVIASFARPVAQQIDVTRCANATSLSTANVASVAAPGGPCEGQANLFRIPDEGAAHEPGDWPPAAEADVLIGRTCTQLRVARGGMLCSPTTSRP
jgi:hypothetical protein